MQLKAFLPLASTALVFCYPFLVRWAVLIWPATPALLLMLPPTVLNAWLAWVFGRTLVQGREPLISTFARIERARLEQQQETALPPELAGYTRRLTVIWSILLFGMACIATALAITGLQDWWAMFTGLISYLLMGLLFFGEYLFRRWRFAGYRHAHPLQMIWFIVKTGPIWLRRS